MSTESTIVKKDNAGALSTINLRADSGKGTEEMQSSDRSTPILKILHQLSPECNSRSAKYVDGAQPGMIYASSFGSLINGEKGLDIIVSHFQTRYPEWQERGDSTAAPVGTHLNPPADAVEEKGGRYRLVNGNYVEKTMYFYVIAILENGSRSAVIPMRSSNLTPGRDLNDMISNLRMEDDKGSFQPASFTAVFKLKTAGKSWGDKNWHVYKPSFVKMLNVSDTKDAELYQAGQKLQAEVSKGSTQPKYEKVEADKTKKDII